jgi:hypothetical protein
MGGDPNGGATPAHGVSRDHPDYAGPAKRPMVLRLGDQGAPAQARSQYKSTYTDEEGWMKHAPNSPHEYNKDMCAAKGAAMGFANMCVPVCTSSDNQGKPKDWHAMWCDGDHSVNAPEHRAWGNQALLAAIWADPRCYRKAQQPRGGGAGPSGAGRAGRGPAAGGKGAGGAASGGKGAAAAASPGKGGNGRAPQRRNRNNQDRGDFQRQVARQ